MQNEKTDLCVKVHITPAKTIAINEQQFKQSNYNTSHSIKSKLVFNLGKYRNVIGCGFQSTSSTNLTNILHDQCHHSLVYEHEI